MKILSNKEYEKIINEKPQSCTYTYYMKDPYQAKKIDELENQNVKLEIELDKKDKEIERLNNIIKDLEKHLQDEMANGRSEDNVWLMGCYDEDREILDKLQELKESDKE